MKISKRDYVISCGIVPVRFEHGKPLFLLLRSRNFWDFPKGRKEEGETDIETAKRETMEEADIKPENLSFKWGKDYIETEPYRKKKDKIGRYFVAETFQSQVSLLVNPELGRPEHEAYKWMTYDEAKKALNERLGKVLDWANDKIGR